MFLPYAAIESFVAALMAQTTQQDIGTRGTILVYPFDTSVITAPQPRLPASPVAFLVAILRTAPDNSALETMLAANSLLRQRTLEVGGTVYLDVSHGHEGGTRWV